MWMSKLLEIALEGAISIVYVKLGHLLPHTMESDLPAI
jgi:hypothetical protein